MTGRRELPTLQLNGPLPTGRFAIEASAGTGKTFSLTSIVARHVAEGGLRADQLLMVTFTRAAARDMRHRTRLQVRALAMALTSRLDPTADEIEPEPWMVITEDPAENRVRLERLEAFLAAYDEATITTIHGFLQIVLGRVGLRGPVHPDVSLVEDPSDLIRQVVSDLLVGALALDPSLFDDGERPDPLKVSTIEKGVVSGVKTVLGNLDSIIEPRVTPLDHDAALSTLPVEKRWAVLVDRAVTEVRQRLETSDQLGFDGLVTAVRDLLDGPGGSAVADAVRHQFRVVLVDEFQDTDQVQWEILSRFFLPEAEAEGGSVASGAFGTVGDPKQAIYRFRGADIEAYRHAVSDVEQLSALDTNFRSNAELITALNSLFDGVQFGAEDIVYRPVHSRPGPKGEGVIGSPALEIRWIPYSEAAGSGHPARLNNAQKLALESGTLDLWKLNSEDMVDVIYNDVAHEIATLIGGTMMIDRSGEPRSVEPGDIAVLVPSHKHAERMFQVLSVAGIPAVRYRTQNVFESRAAQDWQILLDALCQPTRASLVRACMVSAFGEFTIEDLVDWDDDVAATMVGHWQQECAQLAVRLQREGVAGLHHFLRSRHRLESRLVPRPGGERLLTDLDHIAEALAGRPGLRRGATAADVRRELTALRSDSRQVDEYQRRIESDDAAVHLATIHFSKGLEFPIVFLPTMFKTNSMNDAYVYNEDGERHVDVAHKVQWSDGKLSSEDRKQQAQAADLGDEMRKLYVAATRAEQKLIIHWTQVRGSFTSALGRVLLGRDEDGNIVNDSESHAPRENKAITNAAIAANLDHLRKAAPSLDVTTVDPHTSAVRRVVSPTESVGELSVAEFERTTPLQRFGWRKWSYSRMSRHLHNREADDATDAAPGSDEDRRGQDDDERFGAGSVPGGGAVAAGIEFPDHLSGTRFGSMVHGMLERLDPSAEGFQRELARLVGARGRTLSEDSATRLVSALVAAAETPIGGVFGDRSLAMIPGGDRLTEVKFELRLPQDHAIGLDEIGTLMMDHLAPDDPFLAYGRSLTTATPVTHIAGSLYGEIDAVFRLTDDGGRTQYVVSDYKTNLLHERDDASPLEMYRPKNLVEIMKEGDYVLQALLYSVALHRYLRLRLADYDPERHYGGVAYLFVRGMVGPDVPRDEHGQPYGVLHWKPRSALIEALDRRFAADRRRP